MPMNRWKIAGAAATPKGKRPSFYRPFKAFAVNAAAVSTATASCWYALANYRVLEIFPACSWHKASSTAGSWYAAFRDPAFTVLR